MTDIHSSLDSPPPYSSVSVQVEMPSDTPSAPPLSDIEGNKPATDEHTTATSSSNSRPSFFYPSPNRPSVNIPDAQPAIPGRNGNARIPAYATDSPPSTPSIHHIQPPPPIAFERQESEDEEEYQEHHELLPSTYSSNQPPSPQEQHTVRNETALSVIPDNPKHKKRRCLHRCCYFLCCCCCLSGLSRRGKIILITCLLVLFSARIYVGYASRKVECRPDEIVSVPISFNVSHNLRVNLGGRVSGGRIVVRQLEDPNQSGSVEATIYARERSLQLAKYDLTQDDETTFEYRFKTDPWTWFTCIRAEIYINLPRNATSLVLETAATPVEILSKMSVDVMQIKTRNSGIQLKNDWSGKQLLLDSRNGAINTVNTSIRAQESVTMETSDGEIHVGHVESGNGVVHIRTRNDMITGDFIQAETVVTLETSNAEINVDDVVSVQDAVLVKTTNGRIRSNSVRAANTIDVMTMNGAVRLTTIAARSVQIITSSGQLDLNHIDAQEKINVETSNGELNATVDTMPQILTARFKTSNSPIFVHMVSDRHRHMLFDLKSMTDIDVTLSLQTILVHST